MADKRAPGRSLDEWMKLVTECRQSGLTDAAWCTEHGISPSSFYNAVTRLRKRACQIPVNITVQMYPCSEGTDTGNPVL